MWKRLRQGPLRISTPGKPNYEIFFWSIFVEFHVFRHLMKFGRKIQTYFGFALHLCVFVGECWPGSHI